MADDILLTQEEQDERAKQWLKDNGFALAVGIALGLGAVFGYNQYKAHQLAQAESASALYNTVVTRIEGSEMAEIDAQIDALKSDYANTSYAAKAALIKAKQLSVSDLDAAITELRWVADNAPEVGLRHTALIRMAKAYLAQGDLQTAESLASTKPNDGFESHYQEILGDVAVAKGDFDVAREAFQVALDSLNAADRAYSAILTLKLSRLPSDVAETPSASEVPVVGEAPATVIEQSTVESN